MAEMESFFTTPDYGEVVDLTLDADASDSSDIEFLEECRGPSVSTNTNANSNTASAQPPPPQPEQRDPAPTATSSLDLVDPIRVPNAPAMPVLSPPKTERQAQPSLPTLDLNYLASLADELLPTAPAPIPAAFATATTTTTNAYPSPWTAPPFPSYPSLPYPNFPVASSYAAPAPPPPPSAALWNYAPPIGSYPSQDEGVRRKRSAPLLGGNSAEVPSSLPMAHPASLRKVPKHRSPSPAPSGAPPFTCPVCLESLAEILAANSSLHSALCGHILCSTCLDRVLKKKPASCPSCRKPITRAKTHKLHF